MLWWVARTFYALVWTSAYPNYSVTQTIGNNDKRRWPFSNFNFSWISVKQSAGGQFAFTSSVKLKCFTTKLFNEAKFGKNWSSFLFKVSAITEVNRRPHIRAKAIRFTNDGQRDMAFVGSIAFSNRFQHSFPEHCPSYVVIEYWHGTDAAQAVRTQEKVSFKTPSLMTCFIWKLNTIQQTCVMYFYMNCWFQLISANSLIW